MQIIVTNNISKVYQQGSDDIWAIKNASFTVHQGDFCSIQGRSGSGKTTLLNILGGIERPTSGNVSINGIDLGSAKSNQLAQLRRQVIGFVHQTFDLIPYLTVQENILLPWTLDKHKGDMSIFLSLAAFLGIDKRLNHFPSQLSGGERQRVAVARALIKQPAILLADEPTGNLDKNSADELMRLFQSIHAGGTTILLVTHDNTYASYAGKHLWIADGMLYHRNAM